MYTIQVRYITFKENMQHDRKKVKEPHDCFLMLWAEKYVFFHVFGNVLGWVLLHP